MKTVGRILFVGVVAMSIGLARVGTAADGTWNVDAGGSWTDTANWLDGNVPDGAGEAANLLFNITASRTVTLDGDRTVGILNIGDMASAWSNFVVAQGSSGSLIFDNGANPAQLNTHGNFTTITTPQITAPVVVTSDLLMSRSTGNGVMNISGAISGAGNITVESGSFYFSSTTNVNNGFTGNITIRSNATLRAFTSTSLGTNLTTRSIFFEGGTLNYEGYGSVFTSNLTLDFSNGNGTVRLQGSVGTPRIGQRINGNGTFTKTGEATARITSAATNRDNATTIIAQGALAIMNNPGLGTNATVLISAATTTMPRFSFAFGVNNYTWNFKEIHVGANDVGGALDLVSEWADATRTWQVGALYMQNGVITLGRNSTGGSYTLQLQGDATINATTGTGSRILNNGANGDKGFLNLGTTDGGWRTFDVAAGTPTSGYDLRIGVEIRDNGANSSGLIKEGAGILALIDRSGNSTYSGGTQVNNGTLTVLNTFGTATGTGPVTVASGATLAGTGTINGSVTVSGTLAPGISPGTLTINNALTLNSSASLNFELVGNDTTVGGGVNDLVTGVTDLTLDGTLNVSEIGAGTFLLANLGDQWRLINYSGTLTDNGLTLGTMPALSGGLSFALDTATAGQINLSIIPEPSTVGLGIAGLVLMLNRRRRRMR